MQGCWSQAGSALHAHNTGAVSQLPGQMLGRGRMQRTAVETTTMRKNQSSQGWCCQSQGKQQQNVPRLRRCGKP